MDERDSLRAERRMLRETLEEIGSIRMDYTAPEYFLRALKKIIDAALHPPEPDKQQEQGSKI